MTTSRKYLLATVGLLAGVTVLKAVLSLLGGLGDSEALYAVYSLHLQGGYLDHPPMIAWIIRATTAVGGTSALAVRAGSILAFVGTGALLYDLVRRLGGRVRSRFFAVALLCAVPITFLGGLAATPDGPASLFWMLSVWLFVRHVRENLPDKNPILHAVLLGLALGAGILSKYPGVLLAISMIAFVAARRRRWLLTYLLPMVLVAAACTTPLVVWNYQNDWASVMHRVVWTQEQSGFSMRNFGGLVGGQLLYVSPLVMLMALHAMVRWWKSRDDDVSLMMAMLTWIPAIPIWMLCLWSKVAEPHWPVLAYLPAFAQLGMEWGRGAKSTRRWFVGAVASAGAITALGLTIAATPLAFMWGLVEPKTDITNELYGWDRVGAKVVDLSEDDGIVVGPHWVVCAQLEWQLQGQREVGCVTVETDDWDTWNPIDTRDADTYPRLYYVTDDRFSELDSYILTPLARLLTTVEVVRGGKAVREIRIYKR